jgi:hypothetical protein
MENSTAVVGQEESSSELMTVQDTSQIMLDEKAMDRVIAFGKLMASGSSTIPKHLKGNPADCTAVAMQAVQWRMNPYAVAQKSFLAPSGILGYEAQLINAVITTLAPIQYRPSYEFLGDWSKIQGKIKKMQTAGDKGAYFVSDWQPKDEEGLGVIVRCLLKGETEPRELTLLLVQCQPRFSTQWATDPQQQITYAAIRKWSRRYTPDVILGVYSEDEIQEVPSKDINAAPPRPRNGAEYGRQAQDQQQGRVIDAEQESRRAGLITALEAYAKKGSAAFLTQWKAVGKANRADAVLVGEPEYLRLLKIAEEADFNQAPTVQDSFVSEMDQAEASLQGQE